MGLGKTLQASAIMAASARERLAAAAEAAAAATAAAAAAAGGTSSNQQQQQQQPPRLPSLVVCPATLVGHWAHEVGRYVDTATLLAPLEVAGGPAERRAAAARLFDGAGAGASGPRAPRYGLVVMSYEALRAEADWAASIDWDYVVLDEGHVIRSPKSRLAAAAKRLRAQHRLVLSGTPIQNSALELWGLFDFLMPGFLGGEREFNARFGRALRAARYSKRGSREAELGVLAMDALHRQVMPFVLRRTKQQVLKDLPPKIVTDVYCELTPLQRALYEDFAATPAAAGAAGALRAAAAGGGGEGGGGAGGIGGGGGGGAEGGGNGGGNGGSGGAATHVFQALAYLRKLCSHPLLALDWEQPEHRAAAEKALGARSAADARAALARAEAAPKLLALRDILVQCGLVAGDAGAGGGDATGGAGGGSSSAAAATAAAAADSDAAAAAAAGATDGGHRLLIFAQLKATLDLAEEQLLRPLGVTFLRLDGSVDGAARFAIAQRFNADPTVQALLLTTHVGGLGLNLTGADTVVFLEHDWNPMKDLQAMDRAHRLGQRRSVSVFRLITRGTLEERIMGLQAFKLSVAGAVVNQENASMAAMDTSGVLDLFAAPGGSGTGNGGGNGGDGDDGAGGQAQQGGGKGGGKGGKGGGALAALVREVGELHDAEAQYGGLSAAAFASKLQGGGGGGGG